MPQLLDFVAAELLPFVAQDGVRISPITTASGDDHAVARAYYYGLVEEQPFYIVVGAVRRGAHQLFAMAFVQDPVQRPMPSLALQSIEDVVASLAVDPALLAPGGDSTADWSPDGTRIVFDSNRQGLFFLYTIPASGGEIRRLSPEAELTLPSIVE